MSISKSFLLELQHEVASSKKIISCVPTEKWDWKPHTKSMSLGELSKHIVELTIWTEYVLLLESLDFQSNYEPFKAASTDELISYLDKYEKAVISAINMFDEEKWMDEWQLKSGEHVIVAMPKVAANRFIVNNHIYHHRGQLSVYLRLLDIAIPGMYGPSADDMNK
ncbi:MULTISPECIES: DinB family protein [Myroides]|uniref:Damage-inducible protein DinB n=1 Tax=Myroides albus TaxID=2562892 RepID=A0A6I3LM02_9FLAO|nr:MULTISPECIES: DinB family protein [Myroides]MTG97581.1 damage-inducible protein DinB [Myroides albus]MVX36855.1 damage-inducible protein DinB [Myroides sp. LoEW2-1]UVD81144.1 DinB family protein [Myroides albus]